MAKASKKNRTGRQEPVQSFILPYRKSHGREAVELYQRTGRKALPWQKNLIRDILAVGRGGFWKHQKFGYSVPRRNGKSEAIFVRELWGLDHGEKICHTAHRTTTSHGAWVKLCQLLTAAGYVELGRKKKDEPDPENGFRTNKQNGLERITLVNGGEIHFRTRTPNGGLGEGFDLLIIDEAQEYTTAQESALIYTVSDSKNPQTLFCGTPPTAISSGDVFLRMRNATLAGKSYETGWAEWSIPEQTKDIHNRDLWYQTNPSLGYHLQERVIQSEISDDKARLTDFNIQRLGLWLQYNLKSAVSAAEWEALRADSPPELSGPLFYGVKYGHDGKNAALSVAVRTADDRIFVECIDCRPIRAGNDWMFPWLTAGNWASVTVDGANGESILVNNMKSMRLHAPILATTNDVIQASAAFELAVQNGRLCHMGQPSLTASVTNCDKRAIGSGGGFGYKSIKDGVDITLTESMILAFHACSGYKPKKKQVLSY